MGRRQCDWGNSWQNRRNQCLLPANLWQHKQLSSRICPRPVWYATQRLGFRLYLLIFLIKNILSNQLEKNKQRCWKNKQHIWAYYMLKKRHSQGWLWVRIFLGSKIPNPGIFGISFRKNPKWKIMGSSTPWDFFGDFYPRLSGKNHAIGFFRGMGNPVFQIPEKKDILSLL